MYGKILLSDRMQTWITHEEYRILFLLWLNFNYVIHLLFIKALDCSSSVQMWYKCNTQHTYIYMCLL